MNLRHGVKPVKVLGVLCRTRLTGFWTTGKKKVLLDILSPPRRDSASKPRLVNTNTHTHCGIPTKCDQCDGISTTRANDLERACS